MKKITKYIPNTITCLNLFSGCVACIFAFKGDFSLAAFCIYFSAIFDFFDGMAARVLKAYSPIGKELDSLADVISFGVAPGFIVYNWLIIITSPDSLIPYIGFLIPVFSALRLAKFNIDDRQTTSFIGLPVPANAIFFASLIALNNVDQLSLILNNIWIIIILTIVFSLLLVSELPMFSLKFKNLSLKNNKAQYILIIASIILLIVFQLVALPLIIILFILMSLFIYIKNR